MAPGQILQLLKLFTFAVLLFFSEELKLHLALM